jgi:hypothetical protein
MPIKTTNMLKTISDVDTKIRSYTDEVSSEDRQLVYNTETGQQGIVIEDDVESPDEKVKGKGKIIKWKKSGNTEWVPSSKVNTDNSTIRVMATFFNMI